MYMRVTDSRLSLLSSLILIVFLESSLFLHETRLLFATNRAARHNHHNGLVTRLLAVRATAWIGLILLALARSIFLATFFPFTNGCYTLLVSLLCLLPWAEDIRFAENDSFVWSAGSSLSLRLGTALPF